MLESFLPFIEPFMTDWAAHEVIFLGLRRPAKRFAGFAHRSLAREGLTGDGF